jgi:hypothetical protein
MKWWVAACLAVAGCIDIPPDNNTPMCTTSDECPVPGQVCEENVCWGGATSDYAARIGPPAVPTGLATTELPLLSIDPDGWIADLVIGRSVKLSGRVVLDCEPGPMCPATTIEAAVIVSRRSTIPGAPDITFQKTSTAGLETGQSFSFDLPPTTDVENQWTITVLPARGDQPAPADDYPAFQTSMWISQDTEDVEIRLGSGMSNTVTGSLFGLAEGDYRVYARGRWDPTSTSPGTALSSIAYPDGSGAFTIKLPSQLRGTVDIVAEPTTSDRSTPIPTLLQLAIPVQADGTTALAHQIVRPTGVPVPETITVWVRGPTTAGPLIPIENAEITLTADITDFAAGNPTVAHYEINGVTMPDGYALLSIIPFAADSYSMRINPPPSNEPYGSLFAEEVEPGTTFIDSVLPEQVAVTGSLIDATGAAVVGAEVKLVPNPGWLSQSLTPAMQSQVLEVVRSGQPTNDDGSFALYVDAMVAESPAYYDLQIEPVGLHPRWTFTLVGLGALGLVQLPTAAYTRGIVKDEFGIEIAGAQVVIYELLDSGTFLRATKTTDMDGEVQLVVPAPQ